MGGQSSRLSDIDPVKAAKGYILFVEQISHAPDTAGYVTWLITRSFDFELVSMKPPPCLQDRFYYTPNCFRCQNAEEYVS